VTGRARGVSRERCSIENATRALSIDSDDLRRRTRRRGRLGM